MVVGAIGVSGCCEGGVVAGEAGKLLVHSFGHRWGMRWWGLPGDCCDV